MKNGLFVSLTVLVLVGCGKLKNGAELNGDLNRTVSSVPSKSELKSASNDIVDANGQILEMASNLVDLCVSNGEAVETFNTNLVTAQTQIGPLQETIEFNQQHIKPGQDVIDANQITINSLSGEITAYSVTIVGLYDPKTYRDRVKTERKSTKSALASAHRAERQALRDLKNANTSAKIQQAATDLTNARTAIAFNKGKLGNLKETISSNIEAEKKAASDAQNAAQRRLNGLLADNSVIENGLLPYRQALAAAQAQLAAIPTVDGLKPLSLAPICDSISK